MKHMDLLSVFESIENCQFVEILKNIVLNTIKMSF